MDKKIKEYLKRTEFHLKDFAKTEMAHGSYNEDLFNKTMEEYKTQIEEHFDNLKDNILYNIRVKLSYWEPDLTQIKHISRVKTAINHITRTENIKLMDWLLGDDINDTIKSRFAIKLYLKYYKEINEIMKEALTEIVTDGL